MKNTYKREYHPPHRNILSTFKTKTYSTYVRAIDEFIDNAIDAILRAHRADKNSNKFKIVLLKKGDDLIIMDNGHGAIDSEIKDVVILGSSGTKKSKTPSAHGTFGAGATSAALYLTDSDDSCKLTAVSYRDNKASLAIFDLEVQEGDDEPWGYDFCYDPSESKDFKKKLRFLKEKTRGQSNSGMAIFIENGTRLFPSSTADAWNNISKSIQVNYAKRFKDFSDRGLEIEFEFYSDGSKGERKSNKSSFSTTSRKMDSMSYAPNPELITWWLGGANHQYEAVTLCGIDCGVRVSQFLEFADRDKNDAWANGYLRASAQGIGFIRNGKRIECSTTKAWVFDAHKRSTLVELEYNGDHHPHLRVNQEKTEVILSEEFEKALANFLVTTVNTARDTCLEKNNSKKLDDVNVDHVKEAIAMTFTSERKPKTDPGKTLAPVEELAEPKQKKENESYVGKTEKLKVSSSTKKTVIPGLEIEDNHASRYTPFYKRLDTTVNPPRSIIVANNYHPFSRKLIEAGLLEELFTTAASMLLGPATHGKGIDEIVTDVENFGEIYTAVTEASREARKKKLKIAS